MAWGGGGGQQSRKQHFCNTASQMEGAALFVEADFAAEITEAD